MSRTRLLLALALTCIALPALAQKDWREYPSIERGWGRDPDIDFGYQAPGEFVVGRLMFPQARRGWALGTGGGNWLAGGTAWTVDYPEGDRTFARLLARLTMIDVRAVEQPVNLDDDIDSFYGTYEWEGFLQGIRRVFPDRPIVELPDSHPIFHAVYDLTERPQVPTWQHLPHGYRNDGETPYWRAILDDDDRVMVMITFNNDIADGWQRADEIRYPQEAANLAIRLGVNFAVYALSH
jgi:hypothetical protein